MIIDCVVDVINHYIGLGKELGGINLENFENNNTITLGATQRKKPEETGKSKLTGFEFNAFSQ